MSWLQWVTVSSASMVGDRQTGALRLSLTYLDVLYVASSVFSFLNFEQMKNFKTFCQGLVELDDQVEVLKWLADQNSYMDMDRVAIHGWSYGGYISLMALVSYPHVFKVCPPVCTSTLAITKLWQSDFIMTLKQVLNQE